MWQPSTKRSRSLVAVIYYPHPTLRSRLLQGYYPPDGSMYIYVYIYIYIHVCQDPRSMARGTLPHPTPCAFFFALHPERLQMICWLTLRQSMSPKHAPASILAKHGARWTPPRQLILEPASVSAQRLRGRKVPKH